MLVKRALSLREYVRVNNPRPPSGVLQSRTESMGTSWHSRAGDETESPTREPAATSARYGTLGTE